MNTKMMKLDADLNPVEETGKPHVYTGDVEAKLLWLKDDAHPHPVLATEADRIVAELRIGGFDDWRLAADPQQLLRCVDYNREDPAADPELFNVQSTWAWTAQRAAWFASARWCVDFNSGYVYYYGDGAHARVRAVRSWSGPAPVGQ